MVSGKEYYKNNIEAWDRIFNFFNEINCHESYVEERNAFQRKCPFCGNEHDYARGLSCTICNYHNEVIFNFYVQVGNDPRRHGITISKYKELYSKEELESKLNLILACDSNAHAVGDYHRMIMEKNEMGKKEIFKKYKDRLNTANIFLIVLFIALVFALLYR